MISKIKKIVKKLIKDQGSGRNISVFDDDIFIVSYPRSGNTWLRFIIGNMIYKQDTISFSNLENVIPDIYVHKEKELVKIQRPRILKSHEYFDPRYKKVLYIVRDPRDVLLSYYYFKLKIKKIQEDKDLRDFSEDFVKGILDSFGNWSEHIGSWYGAREKCKNFMIVKYEDLIADMESEIKKISEFFNIHLSDTELKKVIMYSSPKYMKLSEEKDGKLWKPMKYAREDIKFIRNASAGSWKKELPQDIRDTIEVAFGDKMQMFGYK